MLTIRNLNFYHFYNKYNTTEDSMTSKKNKLPLLGVDPIYVIIIMCITSTITSFNLSVSICIFQKSFLRIPLMSIGILFVIIGIVLWTGANFQAKLVIKIKGNQLVTTGVYGWVRNPIYSAFLFICTGILFFCNNLLLLFFPPLYWAFLSILMIYTEEKWLAKTFGTEYSVYKSRVNRCIPFPPKYKDL